MAWHTYEHAQERLNSVCVQVGIGDLRTELNVLQKVRGLKAHHFNELRGCRASECVV